MEAVVHVMKLAAEYRQTFHKNVVIDLVCYRKQGHNEMDQPKFTQPKMYDAIAKHKPTLDKYTEKLIGEGVITQEEAKKMQESVRKVFEDAFHRSKQQGNWNSADYTGEYWNLKRDPNTFSADKPTGITEELFQTVGKALYTVPETFNPHPNLRKELANKREMFKTKEKIDWATGEALAFGSLLTEGFHVRLSGQDCER